MTNKFLKKQILAICAILALAAMVVFVWVAFSQGTFKTKRQYNSVNVTSTFPVQSSVTFNRTKHKEIIEKTHLDDIETDDIEFVKPMKISPPTNLYENPPIRHHYGHFRQKQAESWDLHPFYEIDAFGQKLILELDGNGKFLAPNLHIVTHFRENFTQRTKHDPRVSGCFYTGKIRSDRNSSVTVSLCNGMTGYIKTTDNSYYIEPAEKFIDGSMASLIHRIKRLPHPTRKANDVTFDTNAFYENSENHTIVIDDLNETDDNPKNHQLRKRSVHRYDSNSNDIEGTCDVITNTARIEPEDGPRPRRNAEWSNINRMRNVSYVKVLIVADRTMVKYHLTQDDLTFYILTIMGHVSFLFKEETIGNAISVALVRIEILNDIDFSNTNSAGMLQKFCAWTRDNIQDRAHNVAVLLTRDTICRNDNDIYQHCSTLGVAQVDSMCQSGCAIVKDKGLATSFTIAHEIGHVLGMPHDEDKKCERFNRDINTNNIMTSVFKRSFTWSPCSSYYVTEFLNSGRSSCLSKPPTNDYLPTFAYTDTLPGDKIDLEIQCELEFGPGTRVCLSNEISDLLGYKSHEWLSPSVSAPCQYLYCFIANTSQCLSTFVPWADGTRCGDRKVCFNGQCRNEYELIPRDGGWGSWQAYGPCSRTCGGGVAAAKRFCNSPKPVNGGQYCIGENVRYQSCSTSDCEIGAVEFREQQCADFNGRTDEIINTTSSIRWDPDYDIENPEDYCRLFCIPNKVKPSYRLQDKVVDGTKCGPSGFGICVNGICVEGGCDNILNSSMVLDECGICGGDNSRCQEISKTYNKSAETIPSYNKVDRIPKGSSNINITQYSYPYSARDSTYLVLTDGETGAFLLNGDRLVNMDARDIQFGNIKLKYSGANTSTEWIISEKNKKLPKDLVIKVLSYDSSVPNIHYRYIIDVKEAPRYPRYHYSSYRGFSRSYAWQLNPNQPWTKCNSICEGKQYRKPVCMDLLTQNEVKHTFCDNLEESSSIQTRDCNMHCELTWNIASKSACTPQCGKGVRNVYYNCMKVHKTTNKLNYNEFVNDKHCTILTTPSARETCNTICNSTRWHYSQWSECSKTCGGGLQRRTAKCVDDGYTPIDDSYCNNSEMITEQICNTENCPVWTLAETSSCSRPCGGGYRNLTFYCVLDGRIHDDYECDKHSRPADREVCNEQACGRWTPLNSYDSCSVSCGEGIERRIFVCRKFDSEEILEDIFCRDLKMPTESRACYKKKCDFNIDRRPLRDEFDNAIMAEPFVRYRHYKWKAGDWSTCSQSCGEGGRSKQYFRCLDDTGDENSIMCDPNKKPNNIISCNQFTCPKWKTGEWSRSCNSNCERYRQVKCTDNSGKIVDDIQCDNSKKPENSTKCKITECPYMTNTIPRGYFDSSEKGDKRYRWKIGPWKPCSNFCGKGTRRRHIECEDALNELTVVDAFCKHLKKPKTTRQCERYSCKFAWIEGYWSACSASCGTGVKKRNVTCHRVYRGGAIDPVALPDLYQNNVHRQRYCSLKNKPPITSKCILAHCGDQFVWQPEPWKQCSHQCGRKGRQSRLIHCVNAWTKQRVPRFHCRRNLKPPRKRKCNQWKCLYRSCKEIKHYTGTKENRDYVISLRSRPVQIHCYKMDTPEPLEYISLHPDTMNFAELYGRRLINERSCPYGGQRRDDCPCDHIGTERSGFTKFWKVRLDISSMKIIGDDFTFSKQINGTHVPYGTAGDCYSSVQNCGQGQFEVDLTHTSFRLAGSVRWEKLGPYASAQIRRSDTRASGKCGGYCGNCIPDPNIGLAVEIT